MPPRADSGPRRPDRALAFIRIITGLWFVKSLITKFTWTSGGALTVPHVSQRWIDFLPTRLQDYVASNPPEWYRDFLVNHAIPNAKLFAQATAIGEVAVGLSLTLGLLTALGSLGGLWLVLNYFFASLGQGFNQEGFHVLLIACFMAFIAARAGRRWGLDGWLRRRRSRSMLAWLPLG
jgi:uncharacterized membrane protein YphA (DoxX/SURF4 family)